MVSVDVKHHAYLLIGLSRELRRAQGQGSGAVLSQKLGPPFLQLFLNSCFFEHCDFVETATGEVHKLLRTDGVPTSLTLLFLR